MFKEDPSFRARLNQIPSHPWLKGDLPSQKEIEDECKRVNEIQKGTKLYWTQKVSALDLYVAESNVYRSSRDEYFDVES
jgi:hypothetical protein